MKSTLLKLVEYKSLGFGLGMIRGQNKMDGKYSFKCEFEGGIKCTISLDSEKEIENLEGIRMDFVWKNKKLAEACLNNKFKRNDIA